MAKLKDLWICMDCEEVFEMRKTRSRRCPGCASAVSRPLSAWLASLTGIAAMRSVAMPVDGGSHGSTLSQVH